MSSRAYVTDFGPLSTILNSSSSLLLVCSTQFSRRKCREMQRI